MRARLKPRNNELNKAILAIYNHVFKIKIKQIFCEYSLSLEIILKHFLNLS